MTITTQYSTNVHLKNPNSYPLPSRKYPDCARTVDSLLRTVCETRKKAHPVKLVQIQSGVKDSEEGTADGRVAVSRASQENSSHRRGGALFSASAFKLRSPSTD